MNLKHLTNKALLLDTKNLVEKERELTLQILHHLKEIDGRKLYSDLGYSSLFDYCRRELHYSEGSAQRRIQGARLLAAMPEIAPKIESGELNLGHIGKVATFFKTHDIQDHQEKRDILAQVEGLTKDECEKKLFELSGLEKDLPKDKAKRVAEDKTQVSIILSDETMEKLKRLKSLLGKDLSQDALINFMAEVAIQKIEKDKFKLTPKPRKASPSSTRMVSASVKREVYLKEKVCQKCGSEHRLNFDHIKPFALGGDSSQKNIRLLCFNCNQRERIRAGL